MYGDRKAGKKCVINSGHWRAGGTSKPLNTTPTFNPIKTLQYANDLIMNTTTRNIARDQDHLNSYSLEFYQHFTKWKLTLNQRKCQTIVLKGKMKMATKMVSNTRNLSLSHHASPITTVK